MLFPLNRDYTMAYAIPEVVIPEVERLFAERFREFITPAFHQPWCGWFRHHAISANMEVMPAFARAIH
jgi:hypothetical protein